MPKDKDGRRLLGAAERHLAQARERQEARGVRLKALTDDVEKLLSPPPSILVQRIQERMEALDLNPFSAAKKAGLGQDFVRDIVRGKVKHPSATRLAKLAEALETSVRYLLGETEIEPHNQVAPGVHEPPPAPYSATPESTTKEAVLLPIRFELMADTFRKASDVARAPLGYEAATIPAAYRDRESWWELLRDDSMAPTIPNGSLCQVVAYADTERDAVEEGDIIVIQKRIIEGETAGFNFLERSLRVVSERYPDLGMWFMEYGNSDWGFSDDVLKSVEPSVPRKERPSLPQIMREIDPDWKPIPKLRHEDLDPEGLWKQGLDPEMVTRVEKVMEGVRRIDEVLQPENREQFERQMAEYAKRAPRLVGKVIRVLTPLDRRAEFGIGLGKS